MPEPAHEPATRGAAMRWHTAADAGCQSKHMANLSLSLHGAWWAACDVLRCVSLARLAWGLEIGKLGSWSVQGAEDPCTQCSMACTVSLVPVMVAWAVQVLGCSAGLACMWHVAS